MHKTHAYGGFFFAWGANSKVPESPAICSQATSRLLQDVLSLYLWVWAMHSSRISSMARPAQDVTDAELAVLGVLWDDNTATVRQITSKLYSASQGSQHATVQKLLDRLKAKGFVSRDRNVWPHVFSATIAREELIGRRLRTTAEKLCGGSLSPLLTHLIKDTGLNEGERKSLRDLLDELDP